MSFGFAEKRTSDRLRLRPERNTRSASSRNLSHKILAADVSYDIVALFVSKVQECEASLSEGAHLLFNDVDLPFVTVSEIQTVYDRVKI